jgi:hypothetical protein
MFHNLLVVCTLSCCSSYAATQDSSVFHLRDRTFTVVTRIDRSLEGCSRLVRYERELCFYPTYTIMQLRHLRQL